MDRRVFLRTAVAGSVIGSASPAMLAHAATRPNRSGSWDAGSLAHLLPTVSDSEILIKASFTAPLAAAPVLKVNGRNITGRMTDTRGEMWQFHATGLAPARRHKLMLVEGKAGARPLCEPWELKTFPAPEARPENVRVLLFTCAGGHEAHGFLPPAVRNRLLRRALSFAPDAAVANGDHVYWDLRSPLTAKSLGKSPAALAIAGSPDRAQAVFGTDHERFLKRSADQFMTEMARSTQALYYPEFLPDQARPRGLPGASHLGRPLPISESFGTLRYGRLLEMLLYTVRRTMTMAGPSAVFLEDTVEDWLKTRMAESEVAHVVNVPSNPPGWTAGKWGEWYPDILSPDGKLSIREAKPYWQSGWVRQHDRLMAAMSAMRGRVPLVMSGDLHACALGACCVRAMPIFQPTRWWRC